MNVKTVNRRTLLDRLMDDDSWFSLSWKEWGDGREDGWHATCKGEIINQNNARVYTRGWIWSISHISHRCGVLSQTILFSFVIFISCINITYKFDWSQFCTFVLYHNFYFQLSCHSLVLLYWYTSCITKVLRRACRQQAWKG